MAGRGWSGSNSSPVVNYSFGAALVCVCAIYAGCLHDGEGRPEEWISGERAVLTVLVFLAHALALFALSSEVLTYVDTTDGKSLGLTLTWAAFGVAVVVAGIVGKWRGVRLGGLVVVGVAHPQAVRG